MTPVEPDSWTPQRWSHAELLNMQTRLDPARMTGYADHWRRVIDDSREVFGRLDAEVTRHLEESWRGDAGRLALEALRRYISAALDGLTRCGGLADALVTLSDSASELRAAVNGLYHLEDLHEVAVSYSEPAVAAGNAVAEIPGTPIGFGDATQTPPVVAGSTVPAGFGGDHLSELPGRSALPGNGFHDRGLSSPTYPAGGSPPPLSAPPLSAPPRMPDSPLSAAALPAATMPTPAPAAPAPPAAGAAPRVGLPYLPLMAAAHPGVIGRDDGTARRTPGYLITIDNGNELIGPLPKVAPPVIGAK
jgi:hypothetical protein